MGLSVKDILDVKDPVERSVVHEVLGRAERLRAKRQEQMLEALRVTIHNAIVGAFKGR